MNAPSGGLGGRLAALAGVLLALAGPGWAAAAGTDAPGPPAALTWAAEDGAVALRWREPGTGTATGYAYRGEEGTSIAGDVAWTAVGNALSTTATGLVNGTAYAFEVQALNGGVRGPPALVVATPRRPDRGPNAPQALVATPGEGRARVVWAAPVGGTVDTRFEYRLAEGAFVPAATPWVSVGARRWALATGLADGAAYAAEVRALDAQGAGPATGSTFSTPATTAECPEPELDGRRLAWSGEVRVSDRYWVPSAAPGEPPAASDRVSFGYRREGRRGSLDRQTFSIGTRRYRVHAVHAEHSMLAAAADSARRLTLAIHPAARPDAAERAHRYEGVTSVPSARGVLALAEESALVLHVCGRQERVARMNVRGIDRYHVADGPPGYDWSLRRTASLALSLPADRPSTGAPTVSGTPRVHETLAAETAAIADPDGLPDADATFAYRWFRGGQAIPGATGDVYRLKPEDAGETVTVRVDVHDDLGGTTTLSSGATAPVEAAPPAAPRGLAATGGQRPGRAVLGGARGRRRRARCPATRYRYAAAEDVRTVDRRVGSGRQRVAAVRRHDVRLRGPRAERRRRRNAGRRGVDAGPCRGHPRRAVGSRGDGGQRRSGARVAGAGGRRRRSRLRVSVRTR